MNPVPTAFISHAADDTSAANDLCRHLEQAGIRCWIAPRDVTPGRDYASEILAGIESCATFVLVLSARSNDSPFVHREVERATSKGKPVFPVRIENVLPDRELELFISSAHWVDAWDEPRSAHWERLARAIKGQPPGPAPDARSRGRDGKPRGQNRMFALGVGVIVVAILAGSWIMRGPVAEPEPKPESPTTTPIAQAPTPPHAVSTAAAPGPAPQAVRPPAGGGDQLDPCPLQISVSPTLPTPYACHCSEEATHAGTVWGTDLYTDDSALCQAAVHAGVITASGGAVTVERLAGKDLYAGTQRNGIISHDYGPFTASMRFAGAPAPAVPGVCPTQLSVNPDLPTPFTCSCSGDRVRDGTVWGTDVYTADSSLCQAALHAGAVSRSGGTLTVVYLPGRQLYAGSRRNGVASHDYGAYPSSIQFR